MMHGIGGETKRERDEKWKTSAHVYLNTILINARAKQLSSRIFEHFCDAFHDTK
jgi:hypothetical protein